MYPNAMLLGHFFQSMLGKETEALPDSHHKSLFTNRSHHENGNDHDGDNNRQDIIEYLHISIFPFLHVLLVELNVIQIAIQAIKFQKFFMCTMLFYMTIVNDKDLVGIENR